MLTFQKLFFSCLATWKQRPVKISKPRIKLIKIAFGSSNKRMGMAKVAVKMNLEIKVEKVACQISLSACLSSDSSEKWIPKASEKESAIARVKIPPITANFEFVPEAKPTIKPKAVITPEVKPKLKPTLKGCLNI